MIVVQLPAQHDLLCFPTNFYEAGCILGSGQRTCAFWLEGNEDEPPKGLGKGAVISCRGHDTGKASTASRSRGSNPQF